MVSMTIDLQILAIPFILWAIWKLGSGIYYFVDLCRMGDLGPFLGFMALIGSLYHAILSLAVAWLIWMAFRV